LKESGLCPVLPYPALGRFLVQPPTVYGGRSSEAPSGVSSSAVPNPEGPELAGVLEILAVWKRADLVTLLRRARLEFDESDQYGSLLFSHLTTAEVYAPIEDCERLRALPRVDRDRILQALLEIHPPRAHSIEINRLEFFVDPATPVVGRHNDELISDVEAQRALMIAVATGGPRIQSVNEEYKERCTRISAGLADRGLADPNPYRDLWAWYGKWSSGDLPSYQSRRQYISDLYAPLLERLNRGPTAPSFEMFGQPTGWAKVDRGLGEIRKRLEEASTEEQFQAIGLLCRETLISLAQLVYDPSRHTPLDDVVPSESDAKRMLEAYIQVELAGSTNEAARRHARASLDLANDLQHRRTATFRQAALCSEATAAVVNVIAILSGKRDP